MRIVNGSTVESPDREISITRIFNAPREMVYEVWTDPKHVAVWWGPKVFTNPVCEMDVRPGGKFRIVMRAPDGAKYPYTGIYLEVVPPERLVYRRPERGWGGLA